MSNLLVLGGTSWLGGQVAREAVAQVRSAVQSLGGVTSHWIFVSTSSVYADQSRELTGDSPLLEPFIGDEAGPEQYGEAKLACEQAVRGLLHHLVVRVGLIGGPGV